MQKAELKFNMKFNMKVFLDADLIIQQNTFRSYTINKVGQFIFCTPHFGSAETIYFQYQDWIQDFFLSGSQWFYLHSFC